MTEVGAQDRAALDAELINLSVTREYVAAGGLPGDYWELIVSHLKPRLTVRRSADGVPVVVGVDGLALTDHLKALRNSPHAAWLFPKR